MMHIHKYAAKVKVAKRYNSTVQKGDLVLRKEGLFRVQEDVGQGAFRLEQLDGKLVPRTWNITTMRKCYN
ncbi:hypothetical protein CR513_13462, partial [Mucuna pruriens]